MRLVRTVVRSPCSPLPAWFSRRRRSSRRADRHRRPPHPDQRTRRPHRVERLRPGGQALPPDPAPERRHLPPPRRPPLGARSTSTSAPTSTASRWPPTRAAAATRRPATRRAARSPSFPSGAAAAAATSTSTPSSRAGRCSCGSPARAAASEFLPTVWTDRIAFARRVRAAQGRAPAGARSCTCDPTRCSPSQGRRGHTRRLPGGAAHRSRPDRARPRHAPPRVRLGLHRPAPAVGRLPGRDAQHRADRASAASTAATPGELQGREFIAPQFDAAGARRVARLVLRATRPRRDVRRYSFMGETQEEAPHRAPPHRRDLCAR